MPALVVLGASVATAPAAWAAPPANDTRADGLARLLVQRPLGQ